MSDQHERGPDRLAALREEIADVDRGLIEVLRRRMTLAAEVGRVKHAAGDPIFVPEVNDWVLTRAREHATACGVSREVMEAIFGAVMRGSVERQHRVGVEMQASTGSCILVVGGAGNMGGWLGRFASLLGHAVDVVDPAYRKLPHEAGRHGSLEDLVDLDAYEAILVSVPMRRTAEVLAAIVARRPRGLVVEVASIKDHLKPVLEQADEVGVAVASLHPMFGPGKSVYENLTFVLACRNDPKVEQERITVWLKHPYTHVVPVPFAHHDRLMGWLLGLAHLSGMLFGSALTHSGLSAAELRACASTTYNRQVATALSVIDEDPDLYFDIQQLNPHRGEVYRAARGALDSLVKAVDSGEREQFRELLTTARQLLQVD